MTDEHITVEPTTYTVSAFLHDKLAIQMFSGIFNVTVERRAPDQWAVVWMGDCHDRKGRRRYEPLPSSRTDAFKRRYRFDLDTAIEVAKKVAASLVVNGRTVADARAEHARRSAEVPADG